MRTDNFTDPAAKTAERTTCAPETTEIPLPDVPPENLAPRIYWEGTNRYFGKRFSILGDSISTLEGYNPKGYNVFYSDANMERAMVYEYKDTWWGKVIDFFGGQLLANDSWSGSRVTIIPRQKSLFPSGCSDERTSALHRKSVKPDVIIVYMGTNDWGFGADIDETRILYDDNYEMVYFEEAYRAMLKKLKKNYPDSDIWCCTLCTTFMSKNPEFKFPYTFAGKHMEEYNEVIRLVVAAQDCHLIDLYNKGIPYDSMDGTHPNHNGMETLATLIAGAMTNETGAGSPNTF